MLDDKEGALRDLNRALELDANFAWALDRRIRLLSSVGELEASVIDRINYYRLELMPRNTYVHPDDQEIQDHVYEHFHQALSSRFRNGRENLVEYWPCFLHWGAESASTVNQGRSGYVHRGKYGMGYLCLSTKSLRVVSIGALSKKHASKIGFGLLGKFLLLLLTNNLDTRSIERNDKLWEVPFNSIQAIVQQDEEITIQTPVENWKLFAAWNDDIQVINALLNMAKSGNLINVIDTRRLRLAQQTTSPRSSVQIFEDIEKLASLKERGIITQEEFDQKRKELLARL